MDAPRDDRWRSRVRPSRADLASSPVLVFYELTQACDLACLHCRACAQPQPDPNELTSAEARRLVDQLMEFPRPPMLVLTGGDPLKRADIFDLVAYATDRGLEVSITPSATPLVTATAIERLRDAGLARLAVSIDGADATTHDHNRGVPGSFDRSLQILADAHAAGLETQVNTTLTPANYAQLGSMAELMAQLDIVLWSVFFLVPVGRASSLARLSADQCEAAFEQLARESERRPYIIKTTEAPHYRRFLLQHQRPDTASRSVQRPSPVFRSMGVNDGKGILFVSHTGKIYPSGFLPIECGSFPQHHLVDVYQFSPVFVALRDTRRLEGKCHDCEFRQICGGSRARAFAVSGNLFAAEPDCSYLPTAGYPR